MLNQVIERWHTYVYVKRMQKAVMLVIIEQRLAHQAHQAQEVMTEE